MGKVKYVVAWFICAAALAMVGCSTAYTATAASLAAAERIVQAASEQFPPFDADKRRAVVLAAKSRDEGVRALAEWDVTAEKAVKAIEGAHASVKLGADGLKGVREGLRDPSQLSSWIAPAIRVGLDLVNLLAAVGLNIKVN